MHGAPYLSAAELPLDWKRDLASRLDVSTLVLKLRVVFSERLMLTVLLLVLMSRSLVSLLSEMSEMLRC